MVDRVGFRLKTLSKISPVLPKSKLLENEASLMYAVSIFFFWLLCQRECKAEKRKTVGWGVAPKLKYFCLFNAHVFCHLLSPENIKSWRKNTWPSDCERYYSTRLSFYMYKVFILYVWHTCMRETGVGNVCVYTCMAGHMAEVSRHLRELVSFFQHMGPKTQTQFSHFVPISYLLSHLAGKQRHANRSHTPELTFI